VLALIAAIVASVPLLLKRTRSADGTISDNWRAKRTWYSVSWLQKNPNCSARSMPMRIAGWLCPRNDAPLEV